MKIDVSKIPIFPGRDGKIQTYIPQSELHNPNPFYMLPSYTIPYKYECVELQIPSLVVGDDNVALGLKYTEVQALRIYCRHDITQEREKAGDIFGGIGSEEDPFQNFWKAAEYANCLSEGLCTWVQIIVDPSKPITEFGSGHEDHETWNGIYGRYVVIGALGDGPVFTTHCPINCSQSEWHRWGTIISNCIFKLDKNSTDAVFNRKFVNCEFELEIVDDGYHIFGNILADQIISCNVKKAGQLSCSKTYGSKIKSYSLYSDYLTDSEFTSIQDVREGVHGSSAYYIHNCKITGPNYWEKGYGGAEFSVGGAIHDCTIDRYQIMASGADIHNLTANHAYIWACGENTVIDGLTVNFEVLGTEENKSSFLQHAGNIGGVIKNATITQNIRIGAMYWGWKNYSHWFKYGNFGYGAVNICDYSIVNDVTINSKLILLKTINIPEEYIDDTSVYKNIYAVKLGANDVVVRNLNASMSFNMEVELKNYCFYINDIDIDDKCQGNWRVVRNGKIDVDAGECEPKCQDK
jgi:hypothetical protein